jgi:hypothetical protein
MSALLAIFGVKDVVYLGIILAGIAGGTVAWKVHDFHERTLGEQRIEAADAKAATIQTKHDADVAAAATAASTKAIEDYHEALAAVDVPAPSIVCHAASSGSVPVAAGTAARGDGSTAVPAESTVPFDPSLGILANDKQADAQVTLLQSLIHSYQAAGVVAK